jgi:hypothetical protein
LAIRWRKNGFSLSLLISIYYLLLFLFFVLGKNQSKSPSLLVYNNILNPKPKPYLCSLFPTLHERGKGWGDKEELDLRTRFFSKEKSLCRQSGIRNMMQCRKQPWERKQKSIQHYREHRILITYGYFVLGNVSFMVHYAIIWRPWAWKGEWAY